ncbi:MAG: DUF2868 domain-containing protein [Herminiimonas sp.]|nr:DUF2868 domain-containing protein [Herminiimonas sp.]
MDEAGARGVMLVRAIERADVEGVILNRDDRAYASRSANELAQWDAADQAVASMPELFLQKRAEQILKKIAERTPAFLSFVHGTNRLRSLGMVLPVLSLLAGVAIDRIADPHRVDLLSGPLLLIIFWNLAVYAWLVIWRLIPRSGTHRVDGSQLARLMSGPMMAPRRLAAPLVAALAAFHAEWLRMSAPLTGARIARAIHSSAACFAAGAIVSLYLRGMVSQYRAGWESTFLSAGQVHAMLSLLFTPVTALFQLPGFSVEQIRALEFAQSGAAAGGALWVHLYAGTLLLLVTLPRVLLAAVAGWRVRRLSRRFPLDLNEPYFRNLTGKLGPAVPAVMRVFPYSFTLDEQRDRNLTVVAQMLLGDQARVMLRPATSYGEEARDSAIDTRLDNIDIAMTVALFNLSATPERESHGAFLDQLQRASASNCRVLIDESAYMDRIGSQPGGNTRLQERIGLWRQFCVLHEVDATIVNLINPQARSADLSDTAGLAPMTSLHSR